MRDEATTDMISEFWAWFDSYRDGVDATGPSRDQHIDEILERISRIEPGLAVELGVREDGIKEMTISPDGVRERFPFVEQIVSQAPSMEGWEVVAFRQPIKADFSLQYGDLELRPSELFFLPLEEDGTLDIIVYGQGFSDQDKDDLGYHGLIMMDSLIGEYNCVTQIRHYDFQELPDEQEREGLLPLSQLASFIEARK
jgi:hypothetical protein